MGKTLNELVENLKEFVMDAQSDSHNSSNFNRYRYNNLKLKIVAFHNMPPTVEITLGISEVVYDIASGMKISGGLGPDEKYVQRWLTRTSTIQYLQECYKDQVTESTQKAKEGKKAHNEQEEEETH